MKVIIKGGSSEKNEQMKKFFMEKIFPILDFGIAIELSNAVITVFEKKKNGNIDEYVDPTVEVIVELTEEARNIAMDMEIGADELKNHAGKFHDEALAIRALQIMKPNFSIEYYSCRYTPPADNISKSDCEMCGSIEHMQSVTGECPG
ncbi:MAG: hypothetical protein WA019_03415, partial [Candidatus Moraniibacteriota bacterium]